MIEKGESQPQSAENQGSVFAGLYTDCRNLWELRKNWQREMGDPQALIRDFETFTVPQTLRNNIMHLTYLDMVQKGSANYATDVEKDEERTKSLKINLRLLGDDENEPIFVSVPHKAISLFMLLSHDHGVMARTGSPAPSETEITELRQLIDLAKSQKMPALAETITARDGIVSEEIFS
jgi:hypothetical protein